MSNFISETFEAGAAVNPQTAGFEGRILVADGVSLTGRSCGRAALSVAAGAARPLGVCIHAEDRLGGLVTVVMFGRANLYTAAALDPNSLVGSDLNGEGVAIAAGSGVHHVGVILTENGAASVINGMAQIFVNPGFTPVS